MVFFLKHIKHIYRNTWLKETTRVIVDLVGLSCWAAETHVYNCFWRTPGSFDATSQL